MLETLPLRLMLLAPGLACAVSFQLKSEVRRDLGGQSRSAILTAYEYDENGNRTYRRTYGSEDTTGVLLGRSAFTYDGSGRLVREVVLSGGDTLSITDYSRLGDGTLVARTTRGKDGAVRFADSLRYAGGVQVAEERYDSDGAMSFYHAFGADELGRRIRDTLYERGMTSFEATRVVWTSYRGTSLLVAAEQTWQQVNGGWFETEMATMSFADGRLVGIARHATDGSSRPLVDSIAFVYDVNGNRLREVLFDADEAPVYSIDYNWVALQTTGGPGFFGHRPIARGLIFQVGNHLRLADGEAETVSLSDATGRIVWNGAWPRGSQVFELPRLPKGPYLAVAHGASRPAVGRFVVQ